MAHQLFKCFITSAFLWANAVQAISFSDEQKQEMGQIIKEYLISHPEVIAQAIQALQNKEIQAWTEQVKKIIISHQNEIFKSQSPVLTVENPKLTIVEFFDYNCQHCKKFNQILRTTLSKDKEIQVIYKELPILSESSIFASKAALAALQQNKYQEFHQKLMSYDEVLSEANVLRLAKEVGLDMIKLKKDMNNPQIMEELRDNQKLAVELGIRGTPTIIITKYPANKNMPIEVIPGEISQETLNEKIALIKAPSPSQSPN